MSGTGEAVVFSVVLTVTGSLQDAEAVFDNAARTDFSGVAPNAEISVVCIEGDVVESREDALQDLMDLSRDVLVESGELEPDGTAESYSRVKRELVGDVVSRYMCDRCGVTSSDVPSGTDLDLFFTPMDDGTGDTLCEGCAHVRDNEEES